MATQLQHRFADQAYASDLLIAVYRGEVMGIGTLEELEALIADGILPEETICREPRAEDF
jgi:hypothetical protein